MSYRIEYGGGNAVRKPGRGNRLPVLTAGAFLLFLLLTQAFWPEGSAALRDFLIPGDSEVTTQAFSAMSEDLCEGIPISDALMAFCREILTHGETVH